MKNKNVEVIHVHGIKRKLSPKVVIKLMKKEHKSFLKDCLTEYDKDRIGRKKLEDYKVYLDSLSEKNIMVSQHL